MPLFLQDSSGSAIDTIQSISSATSTAITAWSSTVQAAFTATGQTLSAAAISAADVGKTTTIVNTGTNAFTLAQTGGSITSAIGLTLKPGATCALKAVSTTASIIVGTNANQTASAEYGEQVLATSVSIPSTSTGAGNATDVLSFTLPSAGIWEVEYAVRATTPNQTATSVTGMVALIANNSNVVQSGSEIAIARFQSGATSGSGNNLGATVSGKITIATTGAETFKLRGHHDGSANGSQAYSVQSDANGRTRVSWTKISGQLPASIFTGSNGVIVGTSGFVPAPAIADNTKFLKGDGTWGTPAGGSATLSETLTYGAALNARQPVYLQSDGKVYPVISNGGSITNGITIIPFGVGIESMAVAKIPTVANRFAAIYPYSDGNVYTQYVDIAANGSTVVNTQNTSIPSITPATVGSPAAFDISPNGVKGLMGYTTSGNIVKLLGLQTGATGATAAQGAFDLPAGNISNISTITATDDNDKFLVAGRGSGINSLYAVNTASNSVVPVLLDTFAQAAGTVKSTWVFKIGVNAYVWVNGVNPTTMQFRAFSYNPTGNSYAFYGAATNITVSGTAINISVVYQDATDVWFAFTDDQGSAGEVYILKVVIGSGNVTTYLPQSFTADILVNNDYTTTVHGHQKNLGKFLINWRVSTSQSVYKTAEYSLNRTTGVITQTLAPISSPALTTSPSVFANYASQSFISAVGGYGLKYLNTAASGQILLTFGTFQNNADAGKFIGINDNLGALNSMGLVSLVGAVQAGYTGLTPGAGYYADLVTGGVTTSSASGIFVGRAITTTKIQLSRN